jgi:hypothetical protein
MEWPPVGSGPGEVIVYFWLLWLLLVVGPVGAWIALYYLWLRRRWAPHFSASGGLSGRTTAPAADSSDPSAQVSPIPQRMLGPPAPVETETGAYR